MAEYIEDNSLDFDPAIAIEETHRHLGRKLYLSTGM
jgi:hypothetical protein